MVLCALAFTGAVIYAQFDEDFADVLSWNSRSYDYANGLSVWCSSGGTCASLGWTVAEAQDRSQNALVIDIDGGRVTAEELADPAGLRARGWQVHYADPDSGTLELRTPGDETSGQPYILASLINGRLWRVLVRPNAAQVSLSVQGRPVHLPVNRHRLAEVWGPYAKERRRNAINGPLPD